MNLNMEENIINDIVTPGDSISNKGSGEMEDALNEIKEIEKKKNKGKEKKPIPQSVIFTIFGIISCFLSYIDTSLMSSIIYSYKNKDIEKSKLFLEDIKYLLLFIISLIIIQFKLKKPCIYQIILSLLFSFISYSSTYLYSRNAHSFILLSKVFCIIFISFVFGINNILKIRKNHSYKLQTLAYFGILLAILGVLVEFVSSFLHTNKNGEDNIRFIYHYNDYPNFFLSLFNGICYSLIIFIFDLYCNSIEIVFDTLFYIGLFSGIICFILSASFSEIKKIYKTFSGLGGLQVNYYLLSVGMYLFNIILKSILIKKCSIYSVGIILSSQISIRVVVDAIKYKENGFGMNVFTIFSLICFVAGLFIICFHFISNKYNEKKKDLAYTESFASNTDKKYALINPVEQSDD